MQAQARIYISIFIYMHICIYVYIISNHGLSKFRCVNTRELSSDSREWSPRHRARCLCCGCPSPAHVLGSLCTASCSSARQCRLHIYTYAYADIRKCTYKRLVQKIIHSCKCIDIIGYTILPHIVCTNLRTNREKCCKKSTCWCNNPRNTQLESAFEHRTQAVSQILQSATEWSQSPSSWHCSTCTLYLSQFCHF